MSSMEIWKEREQRTVEDVMLGAYKCKVVAAADNIYIYIDPNTLRAPPPRQMSMKATKLINESGAKEQPRPLVE